MLCPKLTYHHAPPYHRGLSGIALSHPTCHHADIYHRGLLSGIALPNAHLPSCTHIPPGPCERWVLSPKNTCHHAPLIPHGNADIPSCSHIPPGPSERHCSVQRTPVIMHPYTTGALGAVGVFSKAYMSSCTPYTTGQCPHAMMQPYTTGAF